METREFGPIVTCVRRTVDSATSPSGSATIPRACATLTGPVLALRLVYCLGPIVFYGLALKLIWSYPLTPVRHARLRERIERRNARRTAR